MTATLSTHVLDTAKGMPAADVPVRLETPDGVQLAGGRTDHDGRLRDWAPPLPEGVYRLVFDTAAYHGDTGFYPEVVVTFRIADGTHHHVPLLISPFGYSTYRGS
jgi:5-hydroxyisourate hydrolase